jgi:hypothetical protein
MLDMRQGLPYRQTKIALCPIPNRGLPAGRRFKMLETNDLSVTVLLHIYPPYRQGPFPVPKSARYMEATTWILF